MNTAKIAANAARLYAWARRRAAERSTWLGLAAAASALGYSTLGQHLTALADVAPMLVAGAGIAAAAASTSARPAPSPDATPPTAA